MSHIIANLPPVKCFIRREFLYDFQKGHGELEPCWWISIKSLRGQAFRIESYLNQYGALYDKLPLHAYCWKPIEGDPYPLDFLQLWNSMSYDITVIKKAMIANMRCKIKMKDGSWLEGEYLFTIDWGFENKGSMLDVSFSETSEHKCAHVFKMDEGNYFAYPNNRIIWFDKAWTYKHITNNPGYKIDTTIYSVEGKLAQETDNYYMTNFTSLSNEGI